MKNQQQKQQEAAAAAQQQQQQGEESQQRQEDPAPAAAADQKNQSEDEDDQSRDQEQEDQGKQASEQDDEEEDDEDDDEDDETEESEDSDDDLEELYRLMVGKKVNKAGMVVNKKTGAVLGRLVEGKIKRVSGKKVSENGEIFNDKGKRIGKVEPVQEDSDDSDDSDEDDSEDQDVEAQADDAESKADDAADQVDEKTDKATKKAKKSGKKAKGKADDVADDAESKANEATDEVDDKADDTKDKAEDAADDATDEVDDKADDAKDKSKEAADEVDDKADDAKDKAEDAADEVDDKADEATDKADDAADDLKDKGEDAVDQADDKAQDLKDKGEDAADDAEDKAQDLQDKAEDATDEVDDKADEATDDVDNKVKDAKNKAEDATNEVLDKANDAASDVEDETDEAGDKAKDTAQDAEEGAEDAAEDTKEGAKEATRDIKDGAEDAEKTVEDLGVGESKDKNDDDSEASDAEEEEDEDKPFNPYDLVDENSPEVRKSGKVVDMEDNVVGTVDKGMAPKLAGFKVDKDGNVVNNDGHIVAKAELYKTEDDEEKPFNPNDAVNEDSPEVRKSGKIVDMEDNIVGHIDKKAAAKLAGLKVDPEGNVINKDGDIVGKADMIKQEEEPEEEEEKPEEDEDKPFNPNDSVNEDSPEVRKSGKVVDMEDNVVGTVDKEKAPKLAGFKVDKEGNVINNEGHIVAKAELYKTEEEEEKPFNPNDAVTEDSPEVRKSGKVFDMDDNLVGHVDKKLAPKLAGFKVDDDGNVINNEGHVVARAEMIKPEEPKEEEEDKDKPFNPNDAVDEDSPEVKKSGKILDMEDNVVGTLDKKLAAKYAGYKVDPKGNVINPEGNIVATAEMNQPEEEEKKPFNPNEAVDEDSPEVRKSGKIVDMEDNVIGTLEKKLAAKYAGYKVDPKGNVINPEGNIVATAEMNQPEEEEKKPFNPNNAVDENSPEVKRSGKVLDMDDNLVGHVDKKLASKLAGFKVDDDGNVIDNEGHIVAKAEMIQEEEQEDPNKPFNPNTMVDEHSPRVRKSGKVVDEEDNTIGEVDKSAAHKLAGYPVDSDGNIIDPEGHIVGKAKLYNKKSDEQLKEEKEEEEYRKIAEQMSQSIQQSLDKIKPILKNITDTIDDEEAKPAKERDEQKLVDTVKPLIEQGSAILEECNGAIRGLDPSGKIAKQAQANSSARKASPEEHHLAELLAQLSGDVSTTIDRAKKKVRNMPHAKKELSPLWNILQSPLLQILSAVGLLLTGVLGLVGNILNGLGLGSIVNSLLGGIGLNKILEGFGLGDALKLGKKK